MQYPLLAALPPPVFVSNFKSDAKSDAITSSRYLTSCAVLLLKSYAGCSALFLAALPPPSPLVYSFLITFRHEYHAAPAKRW